MGFFAGDIVRARRYEYEQVVKERLQKLEKISPEELDHIHERSSIPKIEILDVLKNIFDPNLTYEEKVEILENDPKAIRILLFLCTMINSPKLG